MHHGVSLFLYLHYHVFVDGLQNSGDELSKCKFRKLQYV